MIEKILSFMKGQNKENILYVKSATGVTDLPVAFFYKSFNFVVAIISKI